MDFHEQLTVDRPNEPQSVLAISVRALSMALPLNTQRALFRFSAQEKRALSEAYALLTEVHDEENASEALRETYEDTGGPIGQDEANDLASLVLYCTISPNDAGERALSAAHAPILRRALALKQTVDGFRDWIDRAWSVWDATDDHLE